MATYTLRWQLTGPSGVVNVEKELTAEGYAEIPSVSIANGQTDKSVIFTVDVSQTVAFEIVSDQDVTVETNSGTPGPTVDTIALKANIPYRWCTNWYTAFKLTQDVVTGLFITNASGSAAILQVRHLYDSTP